MHLRRIRAIQIASPCANNKKGLGDPVLGFLAARVAEGVLEPLSEENRKNEVRGASRNTVVVLQPNCNRSQVLLSAIPPPPFSVPGLPSTGISIEYLVPPGLSYTIDVIGAYAVALFQVAIALGAVAALTRNRMVWLGSLGGGAVGLAFFVAALLGR